MEGKKNKAPDDLLCPLCMDLFRRATLLACGHTFCLGCLQNMDVGLAKKSSTLTCPLCRKPTTLSKERTNGLPRNFTVDSLVSDFQTVSPLYRAVSPGARAASCRSGMPLPGIPITEPLHIIKEMEMPGGMRGMAALSTDTIVVGYGSSIPGAHSFTVNGVRKQYLDPSIGMVRDITILNDGRSVVSHGPNNMREYNSSGYPTDRPFKPDRQSTFHFNICSDKTDTIYAVNGRQQINVFKMGKTMPSKVIKTPDLKPWQICVTSAGTMICCTDIGGKSKNAISVFDKNGNKGSSIKMPEDAENSYLFAAVDSLDRVFVARVNPRVGTFKLSIYEACGNRLTEIYSFKELKVRSSEFIWHCMVCLSPNVIAVANLGGILYFIRVPSITKSSSATF